MKNTQFRRDVNSTQLCRPRLRRGLALAFALACVAGFSTPVRAGALKQAWIKSFQLIDPDTGRVILNRDLKYMQRVSARCTFAFLPVSGPPSQVTPFLVGIYVNEFKQVVRMSNVWDPHIKTDGAVGYGYATVPVNTTGTNGHYSDFGRNGMVCVVGSKRNELVYNVVAPAPKQPPRSFQRRGLGGRLAATPNLAAMPNAHIRKCRPSVFATSRIDANQFFGQYGPTTKIPESHFTLYLDKVEAINDSLFCSYATRAGNAKTTVEISCKAASLSDKASNAYYCH